MNVLASQTANSLRHEPGRWTRGRFEAVRDDGLSVWLSNGYYGLDISQNKDARSAFGRATLYGGVTVLSTFFGWATPWRRAVLSAAKTLPLLEWDEFYDRAYRGAEWSA